MKPSEPESRAEKVDAVRSRIENDLDSRERRVGHDLASLDPREQSHVMFWLGGVAVSKDPESLLLLNLVLDNQISLSEARTGEPLKWIRMISYMQELDGITETPENALQKWRKLNATEREVLVQTYDRLAKRPGGIENPRRQPSPRDLERLKLGAEALALPEPTSPDEIRRQLVTLHMAATAMQSLDDLGTDHTNKRAHRDLQTLIDKHDRLTEKLRREF